MRLKPFALSLALISGMSLTGCLQTLDNLDASLSGVANNEQQSSGVKTLKEKAANGDADASYQLGLAYAAGSGIEQDTGAAVNWYRRAAEQQHTAASYMLGMAYASGQGTSKDDRMAFRWISAAARKLHPAAMQKLGDFYVNGIGTSEDRLLGARWYGRAASLGHKEGQFSYGVAWARGIGLPVNKVESWVWLHRATRQGHDLAARVRDKIGEDLSGVERTRAQGYAGQSLNTDSAATAMQAFSDIPTVRYVQSALSALGFRPGPADGIMGPATRGAITAFRQNIGLTPSRGGVIDELLIAALHDNLVNTNKA